MHNLISLVVDSPIPVFGTAWPYYHHVLISRRENQTCVSAPRQCCRSAGQFSNRTNLNACTAHCGRVKCTVSTHGTCRIIYHSALYQNPRTFIRLLPQQG